MGCDYGQGTWIADVLNHQAAEELLEKIQKDKSGASFIKHP
jgi:EAL domain-containing protein (putative c-di-GMP-specific phosphodiesterase class I)